MAGCPSCGFANPDGFKFCGSCGGKLAAGAPAPAPAAGQPIGGITTSPGAPAPEAPPPPEPAPATEPAAPSVKMRQPAEERRTVSILFADVAGFTAMSEKLDPEDVQEIMRGVFDRVASVISGYGGTIDKYIGDAIMAIFGAPVALGDDAERAVRAGLAIQRSIGEYSTELQQKRGFPLRVRVGVNTGKVVWGRAAESQDFTVVGDAVNLASRLQNAAEVGTVIVGESTHRLVRRRFVLEPLEPIMVKGKAEPQRIFKVGPEIVGALRTATSEVRAPLHGRDDEIALLDAAIAGVKRGSGSVVTIDAPAGAGKSRLLRETRQDAEDEGLLTLNGRAPPFGHGAPYSPWTDLLQRAARLEGASAPDARTRLASWLAGAAGDGIDVLAFHELANIADEGNDEIRRRRAAPARFRELLRDALTSFLRAAGSRRPIAMLVEDLHWWPSPAVELLRTATEAARDAAVLVVATKRPAPLAVAWPPAETDRVITLAPLDRAALLALAHDKLGQNVPPELVHRLESVSLGNPLFAEEIIQAYIDRGALKPSADRARWIWDEALAQAVGLPTSVEGVTQARLDALPPFDKRAVLSAAVAGRNFWEGSLPGAGSPELPAALTRLIAREIIQTRRSRIAGEREYEFRHAVVQSVAYEHTLKKERAQDHRRIAAWLEAKAGDRAEFAGEIGEHWKRADEPRRALPFVLVAAAAAVRAFARLDEATVVEDAVTLAEAVGDETALTKALCLRGRLRRIAAHAGAEADLRRALELAERLSDPRSAAEAGVDLAGVLHQRGAFADAEAVATRTLDASRRAGSLRHETQALNMLGVVEQMRGKHDEAEARYHAALDCARRDGDPALEGFVLLTIGYHLQSLDRQREAIAAFESALGKTSRENEAFLRSNLGAAWLDLGDAPRAAEMLDEALAIARKIGSRFLEAEATIRHGAATAVRDLRAGIEEIERGCEMARGINATEPLAEGLLRGALLVAATDAAGARTRLEEARALAERDGLSDLLKKIEAGKASLG